MIFTKIDYKRYDIVLVNFGNNGLGSEQNGTRPAVIIQNDKGNKHSSTTIVMPLTTEIKKENQVTHALIKKDTDNGLNKDSMVLGECMRQVSEKRIVKYIGTIKNKIDQLAIREVYFANFEF